MRRGEQSGKAGALKFLIVQAVSHAAADRYCDAEEHLAPSGWRWPDNPGRRRKSKKCENRPAQGRKGDRNDAAFRLVEIVSGACRTIW